MDVGLFGFPLRRQGDVLLNSSGEVILFIAQIPAVEGIAGLLGSSRLGRGEAVFHFLRGRNGRAAVRIESDGILVDVPLRRQGDVLCDGGIKVIRGGVLLVFAQIPEGKGIALERRLDRQDSLLAALDVLLIGRRETAVSVEGNGIFLRHMYAALRLELPAVPGPDQRDRNDLLIVLDMFQVLERRVELGHIAFGVIVDVAKPVVPVLPRLADEVVFIVLAEQIVGGRMLLRIIYDALDLNSHFKLFQLVSRRGFGLADDFNDRYFTLLLPFPVLVTSYFGVIAEGDGQRCVLLVNEPVLGAGEGVICRQIRRYRDRRGDVVALLVRLHIADRILRRGSNIIRLVSMCCFVVLADDSKTAVQRRGLVRLIGGRGLLAVLNLDHTQAVVQLPRVILVADYKLQRCLVRIVELMRLRFFAVVLCDIRRGLDGHVVFPRLIQSRRFRPVERLALRVVDQVVVFRPAAGRADVLYLNLPDSRFQIVIGGNRNRIAPFPDGVDGLGAVFMFNGNRAARLILRSGRSRTVSPALEGVAFLGRGLIGDGKGSLCRRCRQCRIRLTIRRTGAAIRIIMQFKDWLPDGIDGLGRIVLGQRNQFAAEVARSRSIRRVRPAIELVAVTGRLAFVDVDLVAFRRCSFHNIPARTTNVVKLVNQMVGVLGGGCTLKIIVSSVLTIDKERGAAFTSFVAATASPRNVVNLIVVYTFPDVLGIRKSERIVVDVVLAKINRDVIAADCTYRMAADCITDLDFHAGDSAVHRRMQHDRAITRRHRRHRQHAEHHNQN